MINVEMFTASHTGLVRERNEDSLACQQYQHADVSICVVADGVGGHPGGDIASRLAVDCVMEFIEESVQQACNGNGFSENWLKQTAYSAINYANNAIREMQKQQSQLSSMATTLVLLLRHGENLVVAHVGDSRCYCWHNNHLQQITEDHTVAQQMLNNGTLSYEAFLHSSYHHVLNNGLGLYDEVEISLEYHQCHNRLFMLCSDGLTDCVPDADIKNSLIENTELDDCTNHLIQQALDSGGIDNISIAMCRCS